MEKAEKVKWFYNKGRRRSSWVTVKIIGGEKSGQEAWMPASQSAGGWRGMIYICQWGLWRCLAVSLNQ